MPDGAYYAQAVNWAVTWDWDAYQNDESYFEDSIRDRIVRNSSKKQSDLLCITSKFVEEYCTDLSNDLFLISSCSSYEDERLAKALMEKGAGAVLGFSEEIYTDYGRDICCDTLLFMTRVNPETGEYYTLAEALEESEKLHGAHDGLYFSKHPEKIRPSNPKGGNACPVLPDDEDARDYRLALVRHRVAVFVGSKENEPVRDAYIRLKDGDRTIIAERDPGGDLDAYAKYLLSAPSVSYELTIMAEGQNTIRETLTVTGDLDLFYVMQSAGELSGTVRDAETGEGLGGVTLTLKKSGIEVRTAQSDGNGLFDLKNLEAGTYSAVFTKKGYETHTEKVSIPSRLPDKRIN